LNNLIFDDKDYEIQNSCPWCASYQFEQWGKPLRNFITNKCTSCGLIFVKNRLNKSALEKFYRNYLIDMHQVDEEKNIQRTTMYQIEFDALMLFAAKTNVLDIGCSGGYFLDMFKENGFECYGIEIGEEAAKTASEKHKIWKGDFENLEIDRKFDLILFRAVLQHVPFPKVYLDKACSMLEEDGIIFISSTPNSDAICCDLFKEKWNLHAPEAHLMHFSPGHFDKYFKDKKFSKLFETSFYLETPYADPENDILKVAKAIELKRNGKSIEFTSPAFWGNMMTLIYKK
jgi:2-polyprenyl-3-methyl-5-hydroxy-6-metoxy-1,4-benzoquinol methylase